MIKTKTIKTDKATVLVIGGLPEDVGKWGIVRTIREDVIISSDEQDKDIWGELSNPRYVYEVPCGNWHPLGFLKDISEEQWEPILPEKEVSTNYEFKTIEGYRGYGNNKSVLYTDIRCAGISLVEANCKLENKYGEYPTKENTGLEYGMQYIGIVEGWEDEQEKVFTNPYLLKKI